MPSWESQIPAARLDSVRSAVTAAFGAAPIDAFAPMTGGASAEAFRLETGGRAYVLRLERAQGGLHDAARSFRCMSIAAEAGIAPPLHHLDPETGVAIMDCIEQQPLTGFPGGPAALAAALGELAGRLQATEPFPPFTDLTTFIGRTLAFIDRSGLFAPGLLDEHQRAFAEFAAAYPWAEPVSSHNDPNPRNILFDGQRLWLIDWETSFRNEPMLDLAILANDHARTPEAETALLTGWLGRAPVAEERDRLNAMRPVSGLYYACLILSRHAAAPSGPPETDLTPMTPVQMQAALAAGQGWAELSFAIGKMTLAGFLDGVRATRL